MSINMYFDDLHSIVAKELSAATKSLHIAVAWISFTIYKDLFLKLKSKGVAIRILCADAPSNRKQQSTIDELSAHGIDIRFFASSLIRE